MKGRKGNRTLGLLTGTLLMALIFALNAAALMVTFRPKSYSVSVGDTAEADVLAPMDAVDNAATDVLKQQARDAVPRRRSISRFQGEGRGWRPRHP